jgi:hypothetical protein
MATVRTMEVFRGMGNYALHDIVLEDDASSRLASVLLIEGEAAPEAREPPYGQGEYPSGSWILAPEF